MKMGYFLLRKGGEPSKCGPFLALIGGKGEKFSDPLALYLSGMQRFIQ